MTTATANRSTLHYVVVKRDGSGWTTQPILSLGWAYEDRNYLNLAAKNGDTYEVRAILADGSYIIL